MTISEKNKHHAKTPQIKTLIGHTSDRGFGCAAGREEGEKAHLNLLHASARDLPLPPTDQCTDEKINKFQKALAMEGSPDDQLFLVVHFSRTSFLF